MSTQKKFQQTMPVKQQRGAREKYFPPKLKKIGAVMELTKANGFNGPKTDGAWPSFWPWGS